MNEVVCEQPSVRLLVDALAEREMRSGRRVGLAIGVVHGDERLAFFYGNSGHDGDRPLDEHTVFETGSVGKLFTANLLADLAVTGQVSLDDPIERHLPANIQVPKYGDQSITLEQLATHTSGLPRLPSNIWKTVTDAQNPYANYTTSHLYEFLSSYRLRRRPGTKVVYSNLGMGLLGDILGLVCRTTYEAAVVDRICRPLGMNDTTITLSTEQRSRVAQGHAASGKPVPLWDSQCLQGDGAHRSTLRDMLRYAAANVQPAGTLSNILKACHSPRVRIAPSLPHPVTRFGVPLIAAIAWLAAYQYFDWRPGSVPAAAGLLMLAAAAVIPYFLGMLAGVFYLLAQFGGLVLLQVRAGGNVSAMFSTLVASSVIAWLLSSRFRQHDYVGLGWHVSPLASDGRQLIWHNGRTGGFASFLGICPEDKVAVVILSNTSRTVDHLAVDLLKQLRERGGSATRRVTNARTPES